LEIAISIFMLTKFRFNNVIDTIHNIIFTASAIFFDFNEFFFRINFFSFSVFTYYFSDFLTGTDLDDSYFSSDSIEALYINTI
jgi:hypothetical protein